MTYIIWDEPDSGEDVEEVEIWSCSTETGTYSLIDTINAKDGSEDWVTSYTDSAGTSTSWYKLRFRNSADVAGSYSAARQVDYNILTYTTVIEVRREMAGLDTDLTDTVIREKALMEESHIDVIMRYSFRGEDLYDRSKHGIIGAYVTKRAAIACVNYSMQNSSGSTVAALMVDRLTSEVNDYEKKLSSSRNIVTLQNM